ncbi:MAG: 1-deoxy-D-xylulose-5-phosphate synthase [Paludibacteraceae bacterium]|nr:1-deoxy-D-xylulose-5-phosphate synthase [Paludibacteraceae bacterium]
MMDYKYLNNINSPKDLKALPREALPEVCAELRDFIVRQLSHNPGHLGSSLGVIELTVALHYVFDTPYDRLVWDVGHQAYAHKILTGRRDAFHTNRQFGGLAPFPTPAESEYDTCVSGHASNSISVALGLDVANGRMANGRKVVAVIGDGAMTGGLAFEGLNNASMDKNNLLIVLNDNNMAIDPIKGGFTQYLVDLTTSPRYNKLRWWGYQALVKMHLMSDHKRAKMLRFHNNLKTTLTKQPNNIFQGLNIRYFGPADGHDVIGLVRILSEIKNYKGPKVLHIVTQKGKGYAPAEADQTVWHAPGEFDVETGVRLNESSNLQILKSSNAQPLWQEVFGQTLLDLAKQDKRIVGITPAMPSGCSMTIMQKQLPERVFDVGIAEGHAVTFSAGLAKEGMVPFCNIYSSFLQRAYDNIIHDVAIGKLHVVFCIDRAGIVGNDGATHHGLLDLAFLRPVPNMQIAAPMTASDLRQMMKMAVDMQGPVAIRYPRGRSKDRELPPVEYGKAVKLREGESVCVLSLGAIGNTVEDALGQLKGVGHYNMRWLKPLDTDVVRDVAERYDAIVTVEDGMISGGLGSAVLETVDTRKVRVVRLGVDDRFVTHGSTAELMHMLGLDAEGIAGTLHELLKEQAQAE